MQAYPIAINIISVCWISFLVIWVVAAAATKRSVYRESRIQRLRYSILLVIAYLLLINGGRLPYPLNVRLVPQTESIAWSSLALSVAGFAFCIWARFTIGRNWSGAVTFKEGHELIEGGPYRVVRHPIYTGLLAMFLATVMVLGRIAGVIATALVFLSFWIKLQHEEKLMLEQFPAQYAAYQRRVKRIIPFVL